ncbi:MAG TPA: anti-sigma factor antagonist [Holophagaceae bacterium]|jgi:anti-anti-sigma factor|nr:anti-sigma factor antagonist [Acidobacteriota bacterium]HET8714306.1 anti-sigma factor antagonist [Holophagaceae bacterium]HEU4950518.1 anti-sigma factor antagonist [Holophagaceae bacterium]
MLNIQTRQEGSASVVTIQGKVNFEVTAQLRDVIRETVATQQPKLLVINLDGVSFIDSSGLGLLVAARNSVDKSGGKLHLACLPPAVKKTFDQTNLTNYFSIFATEQDALRGA